MSSFLRGSARPLSELYDVVMLDLDGVVYVGQESVPGAPAALAAVRENGIRLAFVTNNAARTPQLVANHLTELGVDASAEEVITSAQAAARYLADRLPAGARVLVVGTTGLEQALRERGLTPVSDARGEVAAVVQGYSPDLSWRLLAEGAVAINRGVPWIATNVDPTVPSPRGPLPGNGSLVAALRHATRREPVVTGKPDPTMHRETLLRTGAKRPVVVGDRLDTDIEGANEVGCPSLLVFSGVTTVADLLAAAPGLRPTYLAADVGGLLVGHPEPTILDDGACCGRWEVNRIGGALELAKGGHAAGGDPERSDSERHDAGWKSSTGKRLDDDALDAVRALCAAQWERRDNGAEIASGEVRVTARPGDESAGAVLIRLGLRRADAGGHGHSDDGL